MSNSRCWSKLSQGGLNLEEFIVDVIAPLVRSFWFSVFSVSVTKLGVCSCVCLYIFVGRFFQYFKIRKLIIWIFFIADRNAESCNRIPSNYCIPLLLSIAARFFDQVNLWPSWAGFETAIFWQCSPGTVETQRLYPLRHGPRRAIKDGFFSLINPIICSPYPVFHSRVRTEFVIVFIRDRGKSPEEGQRWNLAET